MQDWIPSRKSLRVGSGDTAFHAKPVGILLFKEESMPERRKIGGNRSVARDRRTFEQHLLNANVIVKPLDVPQSRDRACDVAVECRRAVS